jgi:hypothetical protein
MLPDADNPLFYVYAESGGSDTVGGNGSEGLVSEYAELVEDLIKSE